MQWIIHQIDQAYKDDHLVPTTAHWRCEHTENGLAGRVYGTTSVDGLTDLSAKSVLDWIWGNGLDRESTERVCKSQIAASRAASLILNAKTAVPTPSTPIDILKHDAYICIDKWHQDSMLKLTGEPTQVEQTTWDGKVGIAESVFSNKLLTALQVTYLKAKGVREDQYLAYATSVMSKAKAYWALIGIADKVRSDCKNRIAAATTEDEVNLATEQNIAQCNMAVEEAIKPMSA
jgi:hypothetical protein